LSDAVSSGDRSAGNGGNRDDGLTGKGADILDGSFEAHRVVVEGRRDGKLLGREAEAGAQVGFASGS